MQRSISLSPQQKKELLAGRHYYLTKLREVLQQREALLATLEVITSTTAHHASSRHSSWIIRHMNVTMFPFPLACAGLFGVAHPAECCPIVLDPEHLMLCMCSDPRIRHEIGSMAWVFICCITYDHCDLFYDMTSWCLGFSDCQLHDLPVADLQSVICLHR